jgi:DNA polymerase-3 subunit epsilon
MREIVLDTETTGLDPYQGDRLVEIGCIELYNKIPTGQSFHCYVNPQREMSASALEVHGLSTEFLKDKPLFAEVADEFLTFVGEAPLVAHNAAFDLGFLNAELERAAKPVIGSERIIDTLLLARRKHPAGPNRLDDLCSRYGIDNSRRTKHGALLDAEILAEVYIELIGARQAELGLEEARDIGTADVRVSAIRVRPVPMLPRISAEEREAHAAFVASLGASAIWRDYVGAGEERKAAAG